MFQKNRPLPGGPLSGAEVVSGLAPPGVLGAACKFLVGAATTAAAVDAGLQVYLVSVFDPSEPLTGISETTDRVYEVSGFVNLAQGLAIIAGGVCFIALLWRMARNGAILSPGKAKRRTHWAITGWFVPFLNLVRPYDMVKQAWVSTPVRDGGPIFEIPPGYFKAWWWLFIASGVANRVVARLQFNGVSTMRQLSNEANWLLFAQVLTVASGVACLLVLRALTRRQEKAIRFVWEANTQAIAGAMSTPPAPQSDFGSESDWPR